MTRVARVKRRDEPADSMLGPEMVSFFKHSVQKRHTKLGKIADYWSRLVPELLNDHCALESFSRGTLTVIVDSSPHLYELKQLLLAGLQQQLVVACGSAGLKKIALKSGRWYESRDGGRQDVRFQ